MGAASTGEDRAALRVHRAGGSLLSLVVITQDEVDRLEACLRSVPSAAEVVVVDSGSRDGTVELAERLGARVVRTDGFPGFVAQKTTAIGYATQPWVLSLDADERLSPEAHAELVDALGAPGDAVGFSFPRLGTWLGWPIRHGAWWPDRRLRVVRRGAGRWAGREPHDVLVAEGRVRALHGPILHDPYRDLGEHLATIDRYTRLQADALVAEGVRATGWHVLARPPAHFVKAYLLKRGFLDGVPGFAVAALGATHVLLKWTRVWLAQNPSTSR